MTHLDLFSGIGGFSLAVDSVWKNAEHVFCEIDPFCQAILKKHWPNAPIYEDIRTLTNAKGKQALATEQGRFHTKPCIPDTGVSLLTGGFPCQPFSNAGKRKGTNDERHLWPEMRRVIQEFSPHYVVAENVRGLLSIDGGMVFEQVCLDLEALGYETQPFLIPACAVNAPHRRDRIWVVACNTQHDGHAPTEGREGDRKREEESSGEAEVEQPTRSALSRDNDEWGIEKWNESWPQVAARLCRMDDGLPEGVARPKGWRNAALKAYGNAIVPQVAVEIFKAIKNVNLCNSDNTIQPKTSSR